MSQGAIGRRLSVGLLAVSLLAGCTPTANSRYADRRLDARVRGMGRTLNEFARNEGKRPAYLAADFAFIGEDVAHDGWQLDRDLRWWDKQLRHEFERFANRQPDYWREAARVFGGEPEHIERNAIDLFY